VIEYSFLPSLKQDKGEEQHHKPGNSVSKTAIFGTGSSVRLKQAAEVNQAYLKGLSWNTYPVDIGLIHMGGVWAGRNWYVFKYLVFFWTPHERREANDPSTTSAVIRYPAWL
jgi:hypothetical protein